MTFDIDVTAPEFKGILGAISTIADEATFEVKRDGLCFRAMDPSHIALIDINYPSDAFKKWNVDSEVKFGIRVDEVMKGAKRFDKNDVISVRMGDNSMLDFGTEKRRFRQRLVGADASSTPLPKLNFNAKIELTTLLFDKIISDAAVAGNYLRMTSESSKAIFFCQGDSGEYSSELVPGNDGLVSLEVKETSMATYSHDYLQKIVKALLEAETVKIEYSSKMPVRLAFAGDKIHFFLAPRVQE